MLFGAKKRFRWISQAICKKFRIIFYSSVLEQDFSTDKVVGA